MRPILLPRPTPPPRKRFDSKGKGSAFERQICSLLSHWLSNGEHADLFCRNVLSGGRFTLSMARRRMSSSMPGDIMAAHPQAFAFLSLFMVEAKHHQNLYLEKYLMERRRGASPLGQIIDLARRQAAQADRYPLVVARQNRWPILLFTPEPIGRLWVSCTTHVSTYHVLHHQSIVMLALEDLLQRSAPADVLAAVQAYQRQQKD
jgi:hypothetical protein